MKLKPNRSALRLRRIPSNTVVHTPTAEEATELLAILHENGYICNNGAPLSYDELPSEYYNVNTTWCNMGEKRVCCSNPIDKRNGAILTLAEFKQKYVLNEDNFAKSDEEKPQPKFKVGDIAIFPGVDIPLPIHDIVNGVAVSWWDDGKIRSAALIEDLEPYPEPETKTTEDMETKELNLCELLHEGDTVYSLIDGESKVEELYEGYFDVNGWRFRYDGTFNGSDKSKAKCLIFPSRALYEQYPLDPLKAWSVWQKEQNKYVLQFNYRTFTAKEINSETQYPSETAVFRTPADRDKCIEEIKATIEKYSKL